MGGKNRRGLIWAGAGLILVAGGLFLLTPYFKGNMQVNPVLLWIGSFPVYWYGLTMLLGVATAFAWFYLRAVRRLGENHPINLATLLILCGVIGGRVVFVLLKWPDFADGPWWDLLNLHSGGLSIHGALIAGAIAVMIYAYRYRLPALSLFDLLAPPVVVGQLIGRLGNFFNQEAFGGPTNLPWKMWVAPAFRPQEFPDYQFFHPTFLYSMLGLAAVLIILLAVERRFRAPGAVLLIFVLAESVERFIIEFFRVDSDRLANLSLAQWASILAIMIALIISLIWKRKYKPRTS